MKVSAYVLLVGTIVCSAYVLAAAQAFAASKTRIETATIVATASGSTNAQCTEGYANQCTNLGGCSCIAITNATAKGSLIGKGTGTANFEITSDDGAKTSATDGCNPLFVDGTLTNGIFRIDLAMLLVACPSKTSGIKSLNGGYSVDTASNGETGNGSVNGTFDKNTGAVSLKLAGPITTP
jgi:hypothetical protein